MKFVFVGDGDQDPDVLEMFGLEFPRGVGVDVTDSRATAKLKGNLNFRQGETAEPTPVKRKPGRPSNASKALALKIEQVELPDDD